MPDAVELLVLCIHAGCSPTQAVVAVAARAPPAVRPAFADVELAAAPRPVAGRRPRRARRPSPARSAARWRRAIAAADRDGLPLAPVLDRLAAEPAPPAAGSARPHARRLPVRLTFPLVPCTLPSFVLLAIAPAVLGALSTLRANAP